MTILPKSKKEGTIFSVLMCDLMVLGVRSYNLSIHDALTAGVIFAGFPLEFIVAFILDVFVVGVVAKNRFLPAHTQAQTIYMILTISSLMILGMMSFMPTYSLIVDCQVGILFQ